MKGYIKPLLIIFFVLLADQLLKTWIKTNMYLGQEFKIIGNWFIIHFTENNGMAFGLEFGGEFGNNDRILHIRWVRAFVTGDDKSGTESSRADRWGLNGHVLYRFSIATFMASKHDYELDADKFWHVHLDHRHIGSGGDDSWSPSVLEVRTSAIPFPASLFPYSLAFITAGLL